jgi:phosphatidylserine decarboxylase
MNLQHQYVDRETGNILTETLFADRLINFLYSHTRENLPAVFRALTSARISSFLGFLNYDMVLGAKLSGGQKFLKHLGINLDECVEAPAALNTPRKIFERQIRFWDCRPLPEDPNIIVSPADAKVLVGSLCDQSSFFIKEKFFSYEELLGMEQRHWLRAFARGDFAIFRLTPDKYHYNHCPVSGRVVDMYTLEGRYHSCNPGAVVSLATPYSKNKRVVTIINTDVPGGSGVGLVAMIEVVAMMIGHVAQCHSENHYDNPQTIEPSLFIRRGAVKSLYRPGSSTDVVLFQKNRVRFDEDLLRNMHLPGVFSRFSHGFGRSLVETDIKVRSSIASRRIEHE